MIKSNYHTQIFLAVLILFLLMVPPLIYFAMQPISRHFDETSARHSQDLRNIASLSSAQADPKRIQAAVDDLIRRDTSLSSGSFRKARTTASIMFLAGGLFTALLTTFLIVRRLVSPLISLCAQIKKISSHRREGLRLDVKGGAEFQQISNAFNRQMELLQEKDRQLLQSQQMELAGLLAGGMVHEFNTVLTIIRGFVQHLQGKLPPQDPLQKITVHIESAVNRGQHLTRALRPFQREGLIQPEPFDLNTLVLEVRDEHEKLIGSATALHVEPHQAPLVVMGDRHYLQQVLINIINNARDAMPDGGLLRIANGSHAVDASLLRGYDWASPGNFASITVTDSGMGMDEGTVDRIFQPFFTTKGIGEGTGLGLTMAYGIVREHKGFITVRSEAGEGTAVAMYLPLIDPEPGITSPDSAAAG